MFGTFGKRQQAKPGTSDVLIANLVGPANLGKSAAEMDDPTWHKVFDMVVHPLRRLCRSILPTIDERRAGKVVVIGSATFLKALEGVSAYGAVRSAQVGYVRTAGRRSPICTVCGLG
jgi:2-keto-3-deoxy-L-fuconate dehydrogenase